MKKGFTLIEILVAMAIFLTVVLLITDIFLSVSNVQRVTLHNQKALNDLQTTMETINYYVHDSKIDYDWYLENGNPSLNENPISSLKLIDSQGRDVLIKLDSESLKLIIDSQDVVSLTPADLNITEFNLYISPSVSPLSFNEMSYEYESDQQAFVTVGIVAQSTELNDSEQDDLRIQTTISSRIYAR